ncbi:MAG: B12-binding domain-containing radical SAM protein [Candidatus Thorarchaeota archaeon]
MANESVLLIHPPFIWGVSDRFCQPLGVLTLASALKEAGIKVVVLDLAAEGWPPQKFAQYLRENKFTHIGVTIISPFRDIAYSILKLAKKIYPDIITLAGGPHPTVTKEDIFSECPYLDYAVSGEAELDIVEIIQNPKKKFYDLGYVKDLDTVPIPDRSHVRHIQYNELSGVFMGDSATMKWVRGCPWKKCRFCTRNELSMHYRQRSIDKIIEEIAIIQNELKYENIINIDDSLRFDRKFIQDILKAKIKEGLDIPFWALARADQINEKGAQLMKRAGCNGIQIGLESVVPRIVDMYKKSWDPSAWRDNLTNAIELCNKYDIIVIASFIIGAPTETEAEIWDTINYCKNSKLDIAQAFPFQYLRGSEMWTEAIEKGQLQTNQYYTYNDKKFGTTQYTTEELFTLAKVAEDYINSPIKNPGRYVRIVRKFIKQGNWQLITNNLARLPSIIQKLLIEHPYEIVPEELHG